MERIKHNPRSSAAPKSAMEIGKISEKPPVPKKTVIRGVTYVKIAPNTIEVGNRRITFHPDGTRTEVRLNILSGSDFGSDPRDNGYVATFQQPENVIYAHTNTAK